MKNYGSLAKTCSVSCTSPFYLITNRVLMNGSFKYSQESTYSQTVHVLMTDALMDNRPKGYYLV